MPLAAIQRQHKGQEDIGPKRYSLARDHLNNRWIREPSAEKKHSEFTWGSWNVYMQITDALNITTGCPDLFDDPLQDIWRSEEHTSELQSH